MHTIKKIGFSTALLLIIAGCSTTTQEHAVAKYDSNIKIKYPAVSIYYDAPQKDTMLACQLYEVLSSQNKCNINGIDTQLYKEQFEKSDLFYNVFFANKDTEYSIAIATAGRVTSEAPNAEKMTVEVTIYWQNFDIKKYTYKLPHIIKKQRTIINNKTDQYFAQSLVSHIIADIQKDNIFSSDFLAKSLNASDYEKDLSVPTTISTFEYAGQFLYNNPLLGSVISYNNAKFHSDNIDLYVYPIRNAYFNNSNELLTQESENIRADFTATAEQLEWSNINFSTNKPLNITTDSTPITGIYFEGEYLEKFGEKSFTSTYLFQLKDKFVKFRASFPASFITEHIKTIIGQIEVPNESPFMKKLRQDTQQQMVAENKK